MADASQGAFAKMLAEPGASPHTFDANSEAIDFLRENVRKHGRLVVPQGIRGTRSRPMERVRTGAYSVQGTIAVNPSPEFMDLWLPRILGANENNDVFAVAESLQVFGLMIERTFDVFTYSDCYVNRALLRGKAVDMMEEEPQPVELILEVYGKSQNTTGTWPSSPPAIGVAATDFPYIFEDAVLTLQAGAKDMISFQLLIDNHLHPRFSNSLVATSITPRDRTVSLNIVTPATSGEAGLYGQALAGAVGELKFTNGNYNLTISFGGRVQAPDYDPVVEGKQEITLNVNSLAHKYSTTAEISVTNDKTG